MVELPPVEVIVREYQLHQLCCCDCGHTTTASLPKGVSTTGYGERVSAIVNLLSGPYRQSYRQVCQLMEELFGVAISRGGLGHLRQECNQALTIPVKQAQHYVQNQGVLHSDETSFGQGNRDGKNPEKTKAWLWVLSTTLVSWFKVSLSRSQDTARKLIGESFAGIVVSDRNSVYNIFALEQRQLCWAHLKRDFQAMAKRAGASQEIGNALLGYQRRLFGWWHRVRDGTLSWELFQEAVRLLRIGFKDQLEQAAQLKVKQGESNPLAKTIRTCRGLLKLEAACWTFVYVPGVEPTNNAAEQAIRAGVIWRKTSFGSQSEEGSQFVAAMLTVRASLRAQNRSCLDFLTQAIHAQRHQAQPPSLLPQPSGLVTSDEPVQRLPAAS